MRDFWFPESGRYIPDFGNQKISAVYVDLCSYETVHCPNAHPPDRNKFEAMALEASLSRLYAGIHFRSDIEVGLVNGQSGGQFTLDYAETDGAD